MPARTSRAARTGTSSQPGATLIFTRRYPAATASAIHRFKVSAERSTGMPSATPQGTDSAGSTPSRSRKQRREAGVPPVRLQVPCRRLDRRAGEAVAPHPGAQRGIHRLGRLELQADHARDQYMLQQVPRARQGLVGVEGQLERRRFAVAPVSRLVVEDHHQRTPLVHGAARDHEGLDQRQRELQELDPDDAHQECWTSRKWSSPLAAVDPARLLQIEHPRDQPALGMEQQRVQRPLGAGAGRGRILGERQLEEGVQLDALAAELRVLQDHAPGGDVAGAGERRPVDARGLHRGQRTQVPIAQVVASICYAALGGPEAVEAHQVVRARRGLHHVQLEGVVVPGVHQLEPHADGRAAGATADQRGHLLAASE